MQRMTGIILIVVGSIILILGIIIFAKSPNNSSTIASNTEATTISSPLSTSGEVLHKEDIQETSPTSTTSSFDNPSSEAGKETKKDRNSSFDENKKKGDDFEKFIVQKFNKDYFIIKEWTGDKYIDGRFAETSLNPDLVLELKLKTKSESFAVECKWRQNYSKDGVKITYHEQLDRYRKFQEERNIPVFIVIGIGGSPSSPKDLYVVPLTKIKDEFIPFETLNAHKKASSDKFYFDIKTKTLD